MKSRPVPGNRSGFCGRIAKLAALCSLLVPGNAPCYTLAGAAGRCSIHRVEPERSTGYALASTRGNTGSSGGVKRLPSVRDSIEMTRVAGSGQSRWYYTGASSSDFATFSPDGKRFVIVVKRGVLQDDTNRYSMLLFMTDKAFQAPAPKIIVSVASTSEQEGIKNVSWLSDNETVLFLGERAGETTQVYSVSCGSGKVRQLTHERRNVVAYSSSPSGNRLAFATGYPVKNLNDAKALKTGIVVSHESLSSLMLGHEETCCEQLFVRDAGLTRSKPLRVQGRLLEDPLDLFLSPDGRYVALRTYVPSITDFPPSWKEYSDPLLRDLLKVDASMDRDATFAERYELIDTRTGDSRLLLNAPVSALTQSELTWSPDSGSVIVTGVYLPLDIKDPTELAERRSHMFTVEIRTRDLEIAKIADQDLKFIGWDRSKRILMFRSTRNENLSGSSLQLLRFRRRGSGWDKLTGDSIDGDSRPEITVEQGLNEPPEIVAVDPRTGRRGVVWDPNPQFHEIAFAHVEEVIWKGGADRDVRGGLYLPPGYVRGKRYPLVIQTHGFDPHGFWIDGPFTTGFAAQSLAGKGIIVLQVPDSHDAELTPEEAPRMVKTYENAIDYLDGRGLIDRTHVGIIGFSRTCYYVKYMLVHSAHKMVAASVADGVDGGYFQYMAMGGSLADESDKLYGAAPFGKGLSTWVRISPGFLLDRMTSALRIQAMGPGSLLGEWEWFEGLTLLHRPVELVYLPEATHILERPADRIASQQGNVDWFCFWLKNEEDPDSRKSEQYVRWRKLRDDAEKVEHGPLYPGALHP